MKAQLAAVLVLAALAAADTDTQDKKQEKRGLAHSFGHGFGHGLSAGDSFGSHGGDFGGFHLGGHGHHEVKTITLTKTVAVPVPKPYPVPVEKKVPVPYPVKVPVHVPKPYPVPVPKPYPVVVHKTVPVPVDKPYPVPVKVPVKVPVPHPVPYPVHKPVPYPVEKPVPYLVKVPVVVHKPVPVLGQRALPSAAVVAAPAAAMVMSLLRPLGALLVLLLVLAPPAAPAARKLPSYLHVCKRGDPQLEQCVLTALEKIRPKLMTGIPELNVPSIEPLIIPELVIRPSPRFSAVGKDVQVFGGSNFKVTRLRIELNDTALSFIAGVSLPHLSFVSDYEVDGQILVLPIKGRGQLTANVSDVSGTLHLQGKIVKRKGAEYLQFVEGETRLEVISPVKIHLDNLFNGDKALGDATNAALNENSEELKAVVIPVGERVVAQFAIDTANKIAAAFPYEQLLPKA